MDKVTDNHKEMNVDNKTGDCDSNIDDSGIVIEQPFVDSQAENEVDCECGSSAMKTFARENKVDPAVKTTELKQTECTTSGKTDQTESVENELAQLDDADPFTDMHVGSHMEEAKQPTDIDEVYDLSVLFTGIQFKCYQNILQQYNNLYYTYAKMIIEKFRKPSKTNKCVYLILYCVFF